MFNKINTLKYILVFCFAFSGSVYSEPVSQAQSTTPVIKSQIWNLKDADIRAVIQTVSLVTGKTFIIDPRVQGKVTFVSQHPMAINELYSAFLSMLQILNYAAVASDDGVVKIVPAMNANETGGAIADQSKPGVGDELVVRVVTVNNVSASQLVPVLRPLMPQWSSVTAYSPSNSLILAGTAGNLKRLVSVIHNMDSTNANEVTMVGLKHANAKQVVSVINELQSSDRAEGKVSNVSLAADEDSNSILISGNYDNSFKMKNLINNLDTKNALGAGGTEIVYLNYLTAKKLAPILAKIVGGVSDVGDDGGKGNTSSLKPSVGSRVSIQAEESDNAIIIHAPKAELASLKKVVLKLDRKPKQVLVEAIIVKVDESLLNQLGIVWGTVNDDGETTGSLNGTSSDNNVLALKATKNGVGLLPGTSLQLLLHVLMSNGSTDILSRPSIVVMNNEEATISDGQDIGIKNRQYLNPGDTTGDTTNSNNAAIYNTVERKNVALTLRVTPQISPDNSLRLKIDQKDDNVSAIASSDPENPVINTSQIKTSVLVHSGSILVLGGLADHQQKLQRSKVPILGDIPLIGHLFSYTNHDVQKKDLMVFLKPVIIDDSKQLNAQTRSKYDYIRRQELDAQMGKRLTPGFAPTLEKLDDSYLNKKSLPEPKATHGHEK